MAFVLAATVFDAILRCRKKKRRLKVKDKAEERKEALPVATPTGVGTNEEINTIHISQLELVEPDPEPPKEKRETYINMAKKGKFLFP